MVEQDRADRRVGSQVVFVGRIIAVPCDHVERTVSDFGNIEAAAPFDVHPAGRFLVFIRRRRSLEVARIGKAVCADRAAARQGELGAVILADITPRLGAVGRQRHLEDHAARHDADFQRRYLHPAKLGKHFDRARLRHDHQFTVGVEEIIVDHVLVEDIDMGRHAGLGHDVAGRGHGAQTVQEIGTGIRRRRRIPAELAEPVIVETGRRLPQGSFYRKEPFGVAHAGAHAVEPGPFIRVARRGERRAGQLFGIKAVIALLRTVLALRQSARQAFRFKIVAESRHVFQFVCRRRSLVLGFRVGFVEHAKSSLSGFVSEFGSVRNN